jgi:branched-chain amino acid transport system ATP-binding protein
VFGNMTVADNVRVGMHRHLVAARPLPTLRHTLGVGWISLLAETAMALVAPAAVRREQQDQSAEVLLELGRFGERLAPRSEDFATRCPTRIGAGRRSRGAWPRGRSCSSSTSPPRG